MSSLWYSVVEREGHHQRDSNTWRLVEMTSLNAFNAFLETLLPDTSFLLNVIIHWVLLSMIRAYCCCSSIELWVFFLAKINIFYTSRCLVLIFLWLLLLDGAAPNRPIHAPKSAGNTFMRAACVFFFLSHPRVFSAHDFVNLPLFRTSYPGSHGKHSSLFPTTVLAFVLVAKTKKSSELGFLPWSPLASNWCAFMQPTRIIRSVQPARCFLRSIRILLMI